MAKEKIKHKEIIEEAKQKWGKKTADEKTAWNRMFRRGVERWILMWNIIKRIEKEFNIDFHEAVTKIPISKKDLKGKVVDVIEKGYTLNDKVIRYSKVVIGE